MSVTVATLLVMLYLQGQAGIPVERVRGDRGRVRGPLSAGGIYEDSEVFVKKPGSPCPGLDGSFKPMPGTDPKRPLPSGFRRLLEPGEKLCQTRIGARRLPAALGKRETSLFNWNSFGLRYGKRVSESEKP